MAAEVRECTNPNCRLRFPAEVGLPQAAVCPFCASPTQQAALIEANRQHNPRSLENPSPSISGLLDNLRSCFNVGSIFRSADGAGFRHMYLGGTTPTPENPKVSKTALGSEETVDWQYERNGKDLAERLVASGHILWSVEVSERAMPLFAAPPVGTANPLVLVVGNEIHGIDPAILDMSAQHIWIPMQGFKRSLNVAIAFSIAAYHLRFGQSMDAR